MYPENRCGFITLTSVVCICTIGSWGTKGSWSQIRTRNHDFSSSAPSVFFRSSFFFFPKEGGRRINYGRKKKTNFNKQKAKKQEFDDIDVELKILTFEVSIYWKIASTLKKFRSAFNQTWVLIAYYMYKLWNLSFETFVDSSVQNLHSFQYLDTYLLNKPEAHRTNFTL